MRDTTNDITFDRLLSRSTAWNRTKATINGIDYDESVLRSMSINRSVFSTDEPKVGCCVSAELTIEMNNPEEPIPRMATVIPKVALTDGKDTSLWYEKGHFLIDSRKIKNVEGLQVLRIHCYDEMLLAENACPDGLGEMTDISLVNYLSGLFCTGGVDERVAQIMTKGYRFTASSEYSIREMLGYIAGAYGGCFVITDTGQLNLITLASLPTRRDYLLNEEGYILKFGGDRILV